MNLNREGAKPAKRYKESFAIFAPSRLNLYGEARLSGEGCKCLAGVAEDG